MLTALKACLLPSARIPQRRTISVSNYDYLLLLLLIRPISVGLPKVLREALEKLATKDEV